MKTTGFTGTQEGMTRAQKFVFKSILAAGHFHHGDCVGADEQAHDIARTLGLYIITHPPINEYKRAFCDADEQCPAKEYLERNRDIVNVSSNMIATPKQFEEQLRSGTWATIRYARKMKKNLTIIYPDGSIGS